MFDVQRLAALYHKQPIFVEKLPGTPEMATLANEYRASTSQYHLSDVEIWHKLNSMRKAGELQSKGVRTSHTVEQTWPKLGGDGTFTIQVEVKISFTKICNCIKVALDNDEQLPVSRKECYDIVQKYYTESFGVTTSTAVITIRVTQLFPEMVE